MKFELATNQIDRISGDVLVLFAFEGKKAIQQTQSFKFLDSAVKGQLSKIVEQENFAGKKGSFVGGYFPDKILASKIIVAGLGPRDLFTSNHLRKVLSQISKMHTKKVDSMIIPLLSVEESGLDSESQSYIIAESLMLGSYQFAHYKQKNPADREFNTVLVAVTSENQNDVKRGLKKGETFAKATSLARDLVNEQAATATPTYIANLAKDIAKKSKNIKVTVYDKEQIEKMGMHAFLGIARGAATPPKFVFLEYTPAKKSKRKVALVGKGITFDTGGINVKPEGYMTTMKLDMAGAAAVMGVFSVIDAIKPDFSVIGLAALTPNVISGNSIVPGDVVKAMNGKTIEVLHTDAEGRVTLADSLSFAVKEKATEIIDLATLTGACMVALGMDIAGVMSNDRALVDDLRTSAQSSGDEIWELPLPEDYRELNKSEIADISNLPGSRYAGAITAGLFLEEFVDKTKWAHIDIAGPAFYEKDTPHTPKGGTGFGVRLLLHYLMKKK